MTVPLQHAAARPEAMDFLRSRGAGTMPHLHGTLLEHLVATERLLRSWGAAEDLCLAGLCHAAYGTDGFAPFLVPPDDRSALAAVVGPDVEEIVHRYASCDRAFVYPQLGADGPVSFRDRFTRATSVPSDAEIRDFVDLTLANELDVALSGSPRSAPPTIRPSWIAPFVEHMRTRASPAASHRARELLAGVPAEDGLSSVTEVRPR